MALDTILVAEDDRALHRLIKLELESYEYKVLSAFDGEMALSLAQNESIDLVVLDVGLPKMDGLKVCRKLRSAKGVPILMLSSFNEAGDRIVGLELGADDYLGKPYEPRELVARIRALLRRSKAELQNSVLEVGPLQLDGGTHQSWLDGEELSLTLLEFQILQSLMRSDSQVVSREQLLFEIWGTDYLGGKRTVDTHVGNLRKKLGHASSLVQAVRGVGFRLVRPPQG